MKVIPLLLLFFLITTSQAMAKQSCAGEFSIAFSECQSLYQESLLQQMGITPGNPNCSGSCSDELAACEGAAGRAFDRCIKK